MAGHFFANAKAAAEEEGAVQEELIVFGNPGENQSLTIRVKTTQTAS